MEIQEKSLSQHVGKNIQRRRKELGLSQERMAECIGIGQQSLSGMERGRIAPKFERLPLIAETLNCSVADLFRVRGDKAFEAEVSALVSGLNAEERASILEVVARMAHIFKRHRQDG